MFGYINEVLPLNTQKSMKMSCILGGFGHYNHGRWHILTFFKVDGEFFGLGASDTHLVGGLYIFLKKVIIFLSL